jgi:5-methylcytosine-specific restriction endonuclease McrA
MLKAKEPGDRDPRFWEIALRCRGKCVYCGLDASEDVRILMSSQLDHLIPRNSGGSDDEDNLVLACHGCNRYKGAWNPSEGEAEPLSRAALVKKAAEYVKGRRGDDPFYTALQGELNSRKAGVL